MIKANCRERFTAADFDFVVRTLSRSERDSVNLVDLLTDGAARDTVLDNPRLVESLFADGGPLTISPQLYFYILLRHVLKETALADRDVSDYLASLLETFSQTARMRSPADGHTSPIQYVSDMLIALRTASPAQSFLIRAHVGNYSLFITGIFHETVQHRSQRGAPDLGYYEDLGRSNFHLAAGHQVARTCALSEIFEKLAAGFREIRLALNHLSDSLIHLDNAFAPLIP
ncbi:hypothetical protein CfE428DRAFT_2959 [Chthoniobacter flavus Ellin428]|uniref:Uncharacterized protein n=1 Tax=Chthoniobacter flavus Ellin428 TaxID=497964 RepID=B4D234_9BACT|nr:hypothetical protein [Chthoniobacter flavus]EDY19274.1 hypothetical protein CfE428DRAFT_2959 [Chthoniobacter flavus Ellin428]TCO90592.1 hypothetical protein EV701_110216 [Chthoniobacter flavus]